MVAAISSIVTPIAIGHFLGYKRSIRRLIALSAMRYWRQIRCVRFEDEQAWIKVADELVNLPILERQHSSQPHLETAIIRDVLRLFDRPGKAVKYPAEAIIHQTIYHFKGLIKGVSHMDDDRKVQSLRPLNLLFEGIDLLRQGRFYPNTDLCRSRQRPSTF